MGIVTMLTLWNTVSRRLSTSVPLQQFGSPCCAARFLTSALVSPPRTINQHSGGVRGFSFVPGSTCQVDVIRDGNYCAAEVVTVLEAGKFIVTMKEGNMAGLTVQTSIELMTEAEDEDEDDDDDDWLVKAMGSTETPKPQPQHDNSATWLSDAIDKRDAQEKPRKPRSGKPTLSSLGGYEGAQEPGAPLRELDTSFYGKLRREGRMSILGAAKLVGEGWRMCLNIQRRRRRSRPLVKQAEGSSLHPKNKQRSMCSNDSFVACNARKEGFL